MGETLSKNVARKGCLEAFEIPMVLPTVQNAIHDFLERTAGKQISNLISLGGTGAQSVNIFQITGSVYIARLFAIVRDTTLMTNCTGASFDLFPAGGAAVQISKNDGVLSGIAVGSIITKVGLAVDTFTVSDAVGAVVTEQGWAGSDVFNAFIVTQKVGIDTFVRLTYSTTHNPIVAQIEVYCEYRGVGEGDLVAV